MATHSCVLAWRLPGIGEPGGLPSLGLHRVRHDWSDLAAAAAAVLIGIKNLSARVGVVRDAASIPGLGRFPRGGHGSPLQYSCLENFMDSGGARQAIVHRVAKSQTPLKWLSMRAQRNQGTSQAKLLVEGGLGEEISKRCGENKGWLPWKRAGLCPFFLYSYDICAMPWRINWVIHGRLFYLSPGLQNMSPKMELSGTSWSGFTTPYKSGWLFLCCRLCFAKSVFWQIRSMRIWLLCLPTDLLSYFWPQDLQTSSRPEKWQTQHES